LEVANAGGSLGDISFLDLSYYMLLTKGGLQSDSSIHVAFLSDQTAFRFIWRIGGAPTIELPISPYKGTTTTSPFVTLDVV
jgi:HK97 family phage major capsid protein